MPMLGRFREKSSRFASRGFWSLVDQGSFALANFATNVLLARWLGASAYGAFSIAFAIYLLGGVVFSGLLVEPMMVFGSGRFRDRVSSYLRALEAMHWKWCWAGAIAGIGLISLFYTGSETFRILWILALLSGPLFYQLFMRRACYVRSAPRWAGEAGLIYLISSLALIAVLDRREALTAGSALMIMGAASLAAGLWIRYRMRDGDAGGREKFETPEILSSHWGFGRWAVLTGILSWVPGNLYFLALPLAGGNEASGELKAAFNLILPVLQIQAAAGPLLLPAFVRAQGTAGFRGKVHAMTALFLAPTLLWTVLLAVAGPWMAGIMYDGTIPVSRLVLALLGLGAAGSSVVFVFGGALKAMEHPRLVFRGYLAAALVCLLVGIPLTLHYGVAGASVGLLLSTLVNIAVLAVNLLPQISSNRPNPAISIR